MKVLYKLPLTTLFLLLYSIIALAQSGRRVEIGGIVNSYAQVTNLNGNSISIDNISLAPSITMRQAFGIGQKILLIQMKGAMVDTTNNDKFGALMTFNNVGHYEFATISAITCNNVDIQVASCQIEVQNINRTYDNFGSLQIVSVPQYVDVTVINDIVSRPWSRDLGRGGIVTFEVSNTLTLEANIDVSGQGFEGGTRNTISQRTSCNNSTTYVSGGIDYSINSSGQAHGQKGEGLADYEYNGITGLEYGRGPMLNGGGGGNSHNGGGGGGSNYTQGGHAGYGWLGAGGCNGGQNRADGLGGYALGYSLVDTRLFMGGGGGGGQQNNGRASDGANGGGIIVIRAKNIEIDNSTGSRGFYANGADAQNSFGNDGAGGGGGGGAILVEVIQYTLSDSLVVSSNGGNGGDVNTSNAHGAGGGGGVGVILTNQSPPAMGVFSSAPGDAGIDCYTCSSTGDPGSPTDTPYLLGWTVTGDLNALPIELKSFDVKLIQQMAVIKWVTLLEDNTDYFEIERSSNLVDFTVLNRTKAIGNSNRALNYETVDPSPLTGVSYYRLKSVDYDGTTSYSNWKSISFTTAKELKVNIFPNPSSDFVKIAVNDSEEEQTLKIYNKLGNLIHQESFQNEYTYDVRSLAKGIYIVKVSSSKGLLQSKIIKN